MLNQIAKEHLPENVEILGCCDMINCRGAWQPLYNFLIPFKNFSFQPHQRLLILDHDIDYYPSVSSVGNNLYNLFKLISELDISTDHITILTGTYNLEEDVRLLCDMFNLSYPKVFEFSQWYTFPSKITEPNCNNTTNKKLYICLNYQPRTHRKILISLLIKKNLLEHGIVSWHSSVDNFIVSESLDSIVDVTNKEAISFSNVYFRITDPLMHNNEELNLCSDSAKLLREYHYNLSNFEIKDQLIDGQPNDQATRWQADFFNYASVYVITETVGQYRHVYFSEKTWKAMISKKPFLLLSAKHSLKKLKELGFKTFESLWDESYDNEDLLYNRANKLTDILKDLSENGWSTIEEQCQEIVEHNFQHLKIFQQQHLKQLKHI